ncbi:glutathione ABC transporter substrate-binding protein [Salinicoccus hispanicus]|uniref:Glutathione-binding protein GsiB n=1 Tax=Salinicoccus hispanicus TaxID=157225 RepID=A0A6N8TYV6_9STAP|nr:glutathione ABC transporter substrate-binding protein [Salinicoccus hispanicus]MXQ51034.1 glutathione ABC transporter substrate-binding protein GsiB [Salinicoccus hispanicus]
MKKSILFMLVLVVGIILAACGGDYDELEAETGSDEGESNDGQNEITVAIEQNFVTMDPHDASDTVSIFGLKSMYESLVTFDEDGEIVPALAEEYDVSEDGLEYHFKLREGVTFHSGEAFNAETVQANYERIMSGNLSAERNFQYIDSVETDGDYDITFNLTEPFSAMLNKFTMVPMTSVQSIEEETVGSEPDGTGTFKFVEWQQGTTLTVEKFDEYWDEGSTNVDTLTFQPVAENGSRVAMLQTGEADFIYPLPQQNASDLENEEGILVEESPSSIARYVSINTYKDPYTDLKVRQAMNHAIDQETFIQVVKNGFGNPLDSTMASETQYYESQEMYEYDVEKARQLLEEAGYADGFEAEIWGNNSSESIKGMEFVQQQLAEVGIDVEVKSMEEGTLSDEIYTPETPDDAKVQMWYVSWSPSSRDADGATRSLFSNEYFPPNGANTAYYDNEEVTEWIKEANLTTDESEQQEIYSNIQSTVYQDAPWLFLASDTNLAGRSEALEGVYVGPDGSVIVKNAQVK